MTADLLASEAPVPAPESPRKPRRPRQVVTTPDGAQHTIAKAPRADLLWYPRGELATVLVRRTQDAELAAQMAARRWEAAAMDDPLRLDFTRDGWWTTYWPTRGQEVPEHAAVDWQGRIVVPCDWRVRNASPGIEFRA